MSNKVLGYDYNDGGISNQKLALLGLVSTAVGQNSDDERTIYLPNINSYDQHKKTTFQEPFTSVFWEDQFCSFVERWKLKIAARPNVEHENYHDRHDRCGWNYFGCGCIHKGNLLARPLEAYNDVASDLFRSLIPRVTSSFVFYSLCNEIFVKRGIRTVAQLRIEEDWFHYCNANLRPSLGDTEDYYITADKIISKIKKSGLTQGEDVFVVCDEKYIFAPKSVIKEEIIAQTGINTIWKSDIIPHSVFEKLPALTTSLIDFELAVRAQNFVGLSRSTFSNQVSFERFARMTCCGGGDYVYDKPGELLGKRTDFGTQITPDDACKPRDSVP
ncbi:O-fucosyltransferase family protein [Methylobacterium nodulans]|uniref:Uncharacterized protein n=1 Tax=Methylobacterium nodulans (strain LMG 21967 / CNCM I-2342 / ORS 2060) TaxID=460265 RepID=B8IAQ6_METNO|nr:O-fucosyltransferase family protein [Methylobacterium nodulans]ACL61101.1 hypothetical protein Mnod_6297 [Methylobacterium nodulans ORS 2060]